MDDHMLRGLKRRKRAKNEVGQIISAATNKASYNYFDTTYWNSGDSKKLFVPLVGELDCLASCTDSLHHCNYLEAAWLDIIETHDKDGLCKKPAAVFKIRQQCQLLCQACIFALAWMEEQLDYDVPNNAYKDCC
jgi:hypothetical protein